MNTQTKHYPEADANGWIALSKRKPTKEDADTENHVLVAGDGLICIAHYEPVREGLLEYATHWKPAGPGPVVETEEERQKREDFQAFKKWSEGIAVDDFHFYVWGAALAHARKQQGGAK